MLSQSLPVRMSFAHVDLEAHVLLMSSMPSGSYTFSISTSAGFPELLSSKGHDGEILLELSIARSPLFA